LGLGRREQYTRSGKVIDALEQELDRDIVYNVCAWRFPGAWVKDVADSWRTSGDITARFDSVVEQLEKVRTLAQYSGPGHVNDLDMMEIGRGMTDEEDKMHFSMWCMMSSPILLAMDLKKIRPETLAIVSNKELIDIQQDAGCIMARSVSKKDDFEVWVKPLGTLNSNEKAVAVINYADMERKYVLTDDVKPEQLGFKEIGSVRDLWAHEECAADKCFTVPAHGVIILKISGTAAELDYTKEDRESYIYDITAETEVEPVRYPAMMQLKKEENAVIIDVRNPDEHLAGAPQDSINIKYTDIAVTVPDLLPDKERAIVTYCSKGKRSCQARNTLKDLGYKYVYMCFAD
ncbi:MAG: hypothetical protein MJ177_04755, partial [Clostridia bacterium]|nr:hypothetical protein [Clostridia bacterium]